MNKRSASQPQRSRSRQQAKAGRSRSSGRGALRLMRPAEQVNLYEQLHYMVTSGLAFALGVKAWNKPYIFRKLREHLELNFQQGGTLAAGLKASGALPAAHVHAIHQAEQHGTLDQVLPRLREVAARAGELNNILLKSLIKPGIYLLAAAYIIPGGEMIQGNITTTQWLIQGSWAIAVVAVAFGLLLNPWLLAPFAPLARIFTWLPGLRRAVEAREVSSFSQAMSLGLSAGAPLTDTYRQALAAVRLASVQSKLVGAGHVMGQGGSLSQALGQAQVFTDLDSATLVNAEKTGHLPEAFDQISAREARVYQGRVQFTARMATTLIMAGVGLYIAMLIVTSFEKIVSGP